MPCVFYRRSHGRAYGWRDSTIDIDLKFEPESDELFRSLPDIKEKLQINIELAAPSDFIPALPGWQDRSPYIGKEGKASFYHYDPYSQGLAIERGHEQDVRDIESMRRDVAIEPGKLLTLFQQIEPFRYRYPAIDKNDFEQAVRKFVELESAE